MQQEQLTLQKLFDMLLAFLPNKDKPIYKIKAKVIKQELEKILPELQTFSQDLNLSPEMCLYYYLRNQKSFQLQHFLQNWKVVILEEFLKDLKILKIIVNFIEKQINSDNFVLPLSYQQFLNYFFKLTSLQFKTKQDSKSRKQSRKTKPKGGQKCPQQK